VVSKKVHKSAVVRNRIRRRVYEQVRLCMESEPKNVDIVLLAQNEKLAHMTPNELQNEVVGLLKKTVGVL
jgi:ribonuclease P protein component